jgi:hypothetical protein
MEIGKLRRWRAKDQTFPRSLFFSMEPVEQGRAYFESLWPGAVCVSDERRFFYRAFGLERARLWQLVQPAVLVAGMRAFFEGFRQGRATADTAQMPGMFLVSGGRVAWSHEYSHAGDRPDLAGIPRNS